MENQCSMGFSGSTPQNNKLLKRKAFCGGFQGYKQNKQLT